MHLQWLRAGLLTAMLACALLGACDKNAGQSVGSEAAATAGDEPPPLPAGVTVCEVEMSGRVDAMVSGNREILVYTALGDCTPPSAKIIDRAHALGDGTFFAEVFVPCGSKLTLCASIEAKVNPRGVPLPTKKHGALGRELLAEGIGEIEFMQLNIKLSDGPEKTFPKARKVMGRPADRPVNRHPLRKKGYEQR